MLWKIEAAESSSPSIEDADMNEDRKEDRKGDRFIFRHHSVAGPAFCARYAAR